MLKRTFLIIVSLLIGQPSFAYLSHSKNESVYIINSSKKKMPNINNIMKKVNNTANNKLLIENTHIDKTLKTIIKSYYPELIIKNLSKNQYILQTKLTVIQNIQNKVYLHNTHDEILLKIFSEINQKLESKIAFIIKKNENKFYIIDRGIL